MDQITVHLHTTLHEHISFTYYSTFSLYKKKEQFLYQFCPIANSLNISFKNHLTSTQDITLNASIANICILCQMRWQLHSHKKIGKV